MANAIYPKAKEKLLQWTLATGKPAGAATICLIGVKNTYVYSPAHEAIADVAETHVVAPEAVIENPTFTNGILNGDDALLDGMSVGETLHAFVVYAKWADTSVLLCYMDTPTVATIPQEIYSAGGLVEFSADGIFQL